ncbi:MAG: 50S ribosomal protein L1 [Candidatus Kerfeldbacteria bacterium RIFCSPHIGHO2_02_FULL_42_14]|uniref:Large ribosomal subunit protein uL1 n=1 Tax=Candidatus Kerfeldbacteria bacterium RIFCSPHIGHO2_02_FULL_42_14 TaxID=1798540 RepID=A0A1G2ARB3_9BACT|nr:MAG: 50S ribosomal protein L1 [Candidatus Kerfeldbacteria bacterium RIFCSPHIGHO2_02_FULL_42_14]OGY80689.1 MAG: 50S ribosomal protein L1 [Candidatus Kerfeldbacteria bacterium RIFCSPHIGHO2_12_FULL_42_13]OGY82616.1 MAG: 50S ribosomal protein L1 [Candidatus Kerfeldbacteria bacterium RIFCSPLOWO2_02_FULL_42_19]OGY85219.1 MAG: 50S ribosomal protein L1 [Candidatus Kerfeldbacteria bacterium RIFCSPLOWO2_12_FULL_43_9]
MPKISKRLKQAKQEYDVQKRYAPAEAIQLVKKLAQIKFDAGVEVHLHLGIDPKKSDQMVRGTTILPHGTGKKKRIIAFVGPQKEQEAKDAGADIIGDEETIQSIKTTKKIAADLAVATPDMMKKLAPVAKILGQKGMMPNPRTETVSMNIGETIKEIKAGKKIAFKTDTTGNIHQLIGRISFSEPQLQENLETFLEVVKKLKPEGMKGTYIQSASLCTTMGPAIRFTM